VKAEAAFRKALALNPADSEAYLSLGKIANEQDRPAEAVRNLEKAVFLQPENSTAWYQLALTYKKSGQTQKAAVALKQFRSLSARAPSNQ
jgi:Flp pilus assembly protein TadD